MKVAVLCLMSWLLCAPARAEMSQGDALAVAARAQVGKDGRLAERLYFKALALEPENIDALLGLAQFYEKDDPTAAGTVYFKLYLVTSRVSPRPLIRWNTIKLGLSRTHKTGHQLFLAMEAYEAELTKIESQRKGDTLVAEVIEERRRMLNLGGTSAPSAALKMGKWKPVDNDVPDKNWSYKFSADKTVVRTPRGQVDGEWRIENGDLVVEWKGHSIDHYKIENDGKFMRSLNKKPRTMEWIGD